METPTNTIRLKDIESTRRQIQDNIACILGERFRNNQTNDPIWNQINQAVIDSFNKLIETLR